MKKKTIISFALAAALILSAGGVTAFAAESGAKSYTAGQETDAANTSETEDESGYSYLKGRQRSVSRNELYAQAEQLPEEERDAFLAEHGIADTPYSEEAAAAYSYVSGQKRGAAYRQDDDTDGNQDMSGYSYLTGRQRGASYQK